jgi:hypothetical protein
VTQTAELIGHSRRLLEEPQRGLEGVWPRAAAFLARQALEAAVGDILATRASGTERCSARAQFLCLPTYAPDEPAHRATFLWGALSRACHQHAYELAPTAEELAGWVAGVEAVANRLSQPSGGGSDLEGQ